MSTSVTYLSDQISGISAAGRVFMGDPMTTVRASSTLETAKNWSATLFGDTLGNETGILRDYFTPIWNTAIRPRTYGVQFEYRYK